MEKCNKKTIYHKLIKNLERSEETSHQRKLKEKSLLSKKEEKKISFKIELSCFVFWLNWIKNNLQTNYYKFLF